MRKHILSILTAATIIAPHTSIRTHAEEPVKSDTNTAAVTGNNNNLSEENDYLDLETETTAETVAETDEESAAETSYKSAEDEGQESATGTYQESTTETDQESAADTDQESSTGTEEESSAGTGTESTNEINQESGEITDDMTEPESEKNETEDDADSEEAVAVSNQDKTVISESTWGTCKVTKYDDGSMVIGAGKPKTTLDGSIIDMPWDSRTTAISFNSGFDTSSVIYMTSMFAGCSSLANLDLSLFKTSQVQTMNGMFLGCSGLANINLSSFDTSNVTSMSYMFKNCLQLASLNVSGFNTSNVTDMQEMFNGCARLTKLSLSNFNTAKVTNMRQMFDYCKSLTSLDLSSFNTSSVTNMYGMFSSCYSLTSVDLSSFNTQNTTDMGSMFLFCESLTDLNLSGFETANVVNMASMFRGCESLTNLNLLSFNTDNVTNMYCQFWGCSSLINLDLSNFNTSKVLNMSGMFGNCSSLKSLNISGFDTGTALNMTDILVKTLSLERINLSVNYFSSGKAASNYPRESSTIWQQEANPSNLKTWSEMALTWSPEQAGWWRIPQTTATLSFNTNGGSSIDPVTAEFDSEINLSQYTTTKPGYTFTGWYSDPELKNKIETLTLTGDTTVYAGWKVNKVTLTFNTNGGSAIEPVTESSGTEIDLSNYVPSRTGYTFTGWYSDSELNNKIETVTITGDTSVYAGWQINKVTLSFNTNGGSAIAPVTEDYGTDIDLNEYVPSKTGYTFTGWYSQPDLKNKIETVKLTGNTIVYAGWEINKATLTFNANGGSTISPLTKDYGTEVDLGDYTPSRTGYTFTGWYSDPDLKNKVETVNLTGDTTVYAGWQINQQTLTFNTNGGTAIAPLTANYGSEIDLNEYVPTRTGYTFTGWYNDSDLKNKVETVNLTGETTVYAGWQINQQTLTFDTNGGTAIVPVTADYGTEIDLNQYVPTKTGYTFTGWYSDAALKNKVETVKLTRDTTVYAGWDINKVTLKFDTNGGNAISPLTEDYGTEVDLNNYTPSRTGHTFTGWYSDAELKNKIELVTLTSNTTVYAGWQINQQTLSFNTNGGTSIAPLTADYGSEIDLNEYVTTRTGYTFTGWYSNPDLKNKIETVSLTEDATVYAGWEINKVTLTFNTNGGSSVSAITADYGTDIDLSDYVPAKEGYTFTGWYSDADLKNKIDTVQLTENAAVYAGWQINKQTLTFDSNGGTAIAPVSADYGTEIDLNEYVPVRTGYGFAGWYSDPELKNKIETVKLTGDTTVYAGWEINKVTLSFETNGGSTIAPLAEDYGTVINLKDFTSSREGYSFTGWYSDPDLKDRIETVTLNGDKTVYAGWQINEYTLSFDSNGGSSIPSIARDYGTELTLESYVPVKEGYTFTGWYSDSDLINKVDTVKLDGNTTVYAGWQINKYTLTFNTNGGTSVASVTKEFGSVVNLGNNTPSRTGYTFTGWYSDSGLKNKVTSVTLDKNMTVYAGWKINQYTLTFANSSIAAKTADFGTVISLNQFKPKKDNYDFTGWYSDKDLKNKIDSVTLNKNTTVYAGWKVQTQLMHRLYNPNSGEHFYTASEFERDQLAKLGWVKEGVAWTAPKTSNTPVYRLYNPNSGDHHYTTSANERSVLIKSGWKDEGIGWYSDDTNTVPVYRLYNPNATGAGSHHYTTDANEYKQLSKMGWKQEGIGWYGM